jgi:hypothetical protein
MYSVRKAFQAAPWAETAGGARNTTPRSNLAGSLCQQQQVGEEQLV